MLFAVFAGWKFFAKVRIFLRNFTRFFIKNNNVLKWNIYTNNAVLKYGISLLVLNIIPMISANV
jgi:hypothetical protein